MKKLLFVLFLFFNFATAQNKKYDLDIIKILTPNGDGVNDTWKIDDLRKFPNSTVEIYDRYGKTIYKTSGPSLNWDGRSFNGDEMPANGYWYLIDLFGDGETIYTGHIAIIK